MSTRIGDDLELLDLEHELLSLNEEFASENEVSTNALAVLGIQSNERRLTRFLRWLLTRDESHGAGDLFLAEFLDLCGAADMDVRSVESFFVVNRSGDSSNAEIDLVLTGENRCLGVEIKTTHQEDSAKLDHEHEALKSAFPSYEGVKLVYLTFQPSDYPLRPVDYPTILWSDVVARFENQLQNVPGEYEQQLTADFIDTIRTHVMTDFTGISERTELYLKYADAINAVRSAYKNDKKRILDAISAKFLSTDEIGDHWETTKTYSSGYVKLYRPEWYSLNNGVNMEIEPHVKLKAENSSGEVCDGSHVRVRFDVENTEAQAVRDRLLELLGEEGQSRLESSGFRWFSKDDSAYKFIEKPIPLSTGSEDYDPIVATNDTIQELMGIIQEPVNSVVEEY